MRGKLPSTCERHMPPTRSVVHDILSALSVCLLLAGPARGADDAAALPQPTTLLVDQAAVLRDDERERLLARLTSIEAAGRAQIAILIASGTGGVPLAEYALRVAESWQLGRAGRDDGLLILVVPSQGAARMEVGYGLEGPIPDALAYRWLGELIPAMKAGRLAEGLDRLLGRIEAALPHTAQTKTASDERYLFRDHPEWRVPFVLAVFSPFALFPLFFGRWGAFVSAPLFAAILGTAAWVLWSSTGYAVGTACVAFALPLLWSLNAFDPQRLDGVLRWLKTLGNLIAVVLFFAVITLFVSAGLSGFEGRAVWPAPVFAGLLALGLAVFLFPGKPADYLMIVLRSAMQFVFVLVVAWVALQPIVQQPATLAFSSAAVVTLCAALGFHFDSRAARTRALWCFGLAALVALPLGLLALLWAIGGDDLHTRLIQGAAGGGAIAAILASAARYGVLAAVRIGLGGRFSGAGAERRD